MKLLLGTAALGIALISFAGSNSNSQPAPDSAATTAVYQDTIPKRDSSGKDHKKDKKDKKERRDTMSYRY